MARTKIFYNNRTQAVRLPKEVALPDGVTDVEVTIVGDTRVITPVYADLVDWWDRGIRPTDDFAVERDQPPVQERSWE